MSNFNVGDRVEVFDEKHGKIGKGTIVNINKFREPDMMYAIDLNHFKEDYIFVGKENLVKI